MNSLNIYDMVAQELRELFLNFTIDSNIIKRGFATSKRIEKHAILFVGLNPSYTLKSEPADHEQIFYSLSQSGNYKYFKRFEDISEYTKIKWSHLDMLTLRETNQSKVVYVIKKAEYFDFIWKHLLITKEILEQAEPKIIVVENSMARTLLGKDIHSNGNNKWLGYVFEFDENIGTHRVTNLDSKLFGTPVFFTSMLTGQRALDNGSYERLKWHIKQVSERK